MRLDRKINISSPFSIIITSWFAKKKVRTRWGDLKNALIFAAMTVRHGHAYIRICVHVRRILQENMLKRWTQPNKLKRGPYYHFELCLILYSEFCSRAFCYLGFPGYIEWEIKLISHSIPINNPTGNLSFRPNYYVDLGMLTAHQFQMVQVWMGKRVSAGWLAGLAAHRIGCISVNAFGISIVYTWNEQLMFATCLAGETRT
jgi:hypothetical protein